MYKENTIENIICPHCNAKVRNEAKFCPFCGNKLQLVNFCPECGNKIEKGERFCQKCGRNLVDRSKTLSAANIQPAPSLQTTFKESSNIAHIQKYNALPQQIYGLSGAERDFFNDNLGLTQSDNIRGLYVCNFIRQGKPDNLAFVKGLLVIEGDRLIFIKRQEPISSNMKRFLKIDIPAKDIIHLIRRGWTGKQLFIGVNAEGRIITYIVSNVEGDAIEAMHGTLSKLLRGKTRSF
jgi:endogenous inhibitor of DNA gyrase (YacG/DUF329 family)